MPVEPKSHVLDGMGDGWDCCWPGEEGVRGVKAGSTAGATQGRNRFLHHLGLPEIVQMQMQQLNMYPAHRKSEAMID